MYPDRATALEMRVRSISSPLTINRNE